MRKYTLPLVLLLALVIVGVWGFYQYREKIDYHTYLDMQFQREFYEMIGHVENLQVDLSKAMISGSSKDMAKYLSGTYMQAYIAQEKLTQLPFHHATIRKTEEFLSQVGDYCTAMANKALDGYVLSDEEMNTLQELQNYSNNLAQELFEMQQKVVSGGVNFGDLRRVGNRDLEKVSDQMKDMNLINFEERMQDYPELIYDGPFSAHMKDIKPKLTGEEITEEDAIRIVEETFGEKADIDTPRIIGDIENTKIHGYYLRADRNEDNGEISAAVSKIGGKIIWYLNPRSIGESKLDRERAMDIAEEFLQEQGYKNMVATYAMAAEGEMVINFATKEEDVIIYTDLMKVKVALDNGDVIGFETEGYLVNHHDRNIGEPELTEEEAQERLSSSAEIESTRLAIIPTNGNKEVLCYEFKVQFGEDNFLIYIDADTGDQVRILLMVEQEDGTLVI
ncbi:germination protein YpeB [Alkaliphilus serpentinus]|uniref:Germination protein YpeB n=1 Tax=Alkaliphilus serpentinus TaxID=1482731 RepID=A0A833HN82_9FIRM|nr:germination protein YpeB [Alkaliphilus serpentinus]KAB3529278.1 germination protein YpeB [Alkaliphilus serpentinus]